MVRRTVQPAATQIHDLHCLLQECPSCGHHLRADYINTRRVRTLKAVVELRLHIRRCPNQECERYHQVYRPESEGQWALPQHEIGLDVVAYVGTLRYQEQRSIAQIHQALVEQGVCISERSVSNVLNRYDELLAVKLTDVEGLKSRLSDQDMMILAIDGLQPTMGHEVLWAIRECISGELLLAESLLSSSHEALGALLNRVKEAIGLPIAAVVSDGQQSIRKAVRTSLPEVAHGLCHFHYLREAAKEIYEADRHAKKELKKQVRGVRVIERSLAADDAMSEVVNGYCQAVRSALTDDGRPPLDAAGLRLHERLTQIHQSVENLAKRGTSPKPSSGSNRSFIKA